MSYSISTLLVRNLDDAAADNLLTKEIVSAHRQGSSFHFTLL